MIVQHTSLMSLNNKNWALKFPFISDFSTNDTGSKLNHSLKSLISGAESSTCEKANKCLISDHS